MKLYKQQINHSKDCGPYLQDQVNYWLLSICGCKDRVNNNIALGDYNLDGYPDILVTTSKRVLLFESILCSNDLCSAGATSRSRRTLQVVRKGVEALTNIKNPRQATFFDIDEDVRKIV